MRAEVLCAMFVATGACGRVSFAPRDDAALVAVDDGRGDANQDAPADAAIRVVLISDNFERTVSGSWGDAPVGGPWFEYNPDAATLDVMGGAGRVGVTAVPTYADFNIDTAIARDVEERVVVAFDRLPASGIYRTSTIIRQSAAGTAFDLKVQLYPDGSVVGFISASEGGVSTDLTAANVALTAVTPGERLVMMVRATGVQPTHVCGSIWRVTDAEPVACMYSGQDARAALEAPGVSFVSINVTTGTVPVTYSFDSFEYLRVGAQ